MVRLNFSLVSFKKSNVSESGSFIFLKIAVVILSPGSSSSFLVICIVAAAIERMVVMSKPDENAPPSSTVVSSIPFLIASPIATFCGSSGSSLSAVGVKVFDLPLLAARVSTIIMVRLRASLTTVSSPPFLISSPIVLEAACLAFSFAAATAFSISPDNSALSTETLFPHAPPRTPVTAPIVELIVTSLNRSPLVYS